MSLTSFGWTLGGLGGAPPEEDGLGGGVISVVKAVSLELALMLS